MFSFKYHVRDFLRKENRRPYNEVLLYRIIYIHFFFKNNINKNCQMSTSLSCKQRHLHRAFEDDVDVWRWSLADQTWWIYWFQCTENRPFIQYSRSLRPVHYITPFCESHHQSSQDLRTQSYNKTSHLSRNQPQWQETTSARRDNTGRHACSATIKLSH